MKSILTDKRPPMLDELRPDSAPSGGSGRGISPVWVGVLGLILLLGWVAFQPVIPFHYLPYVSLSAHFFYVVPPVFITAGFLFLVAAKIPLNVSRIDLLLAIYALYVGINYTMRDLPYSENLVNFTLFIGAVLLLKQLYNAPRWGIFIYYGGFFLLVFFGLYQVFYGELQLLRLRPSHHSLFNLTGTFHNPGPYAIFLSPILIVALAVVLFPPTHPILAKPLMVLCWGTLLGIAVMLPATGSRSAWVGTLAGVWWVVSVKNRVKLIKLYATTKNWQRIGFLLAVLLAGLVSAYWLYQYKPESTVGRALVWRISSGLFRENALFGAGFEQLRAHFGDLQSAFIAQHPGNGAVIERADYIPYALNDFLQIVLENGLIGLGLFTLLAVTALRTGFQQITTQSPFVIGSTGALMALLIAGFFSYPFEVSAIWIEFLFFLGILSHQSRKTVVRATGRHPFVQLISVVSVGALLLLLGNQIRVIKAKNDWARARNLLSGQSFQQAVLAYQAAFRESPDRPEVLLGYGKALYMNGNFAQSASILEKASHRISDPILYMNLGNSYAKLAQNEKAEKAYEKAISIIPNRLYPRYLLANHYRMMGNWAKARQTARYMLTMPNPVSSPASRQINAEMKNLLATD